MADAVLFPRRHFAKGERTSMRNEDRIVTEASVSSRRKAHGAIDPAFRHHGWTPWPSDRQSADEVGREIVVPSFVQPCLDMLDRPSEIPRGACPARRVHARRAAQRRDAKTWSSSARAIMHAASAAVRAFTRALPAKVVSGSSGSERPIWAALTTSNPPSSSAASSRAFPGLWVAATIRVPGSRRSAISAFNLSGLESPCSSQVGARRRLQARYR